MRWNGKVDINLGPVGANIFSPSYILRIEGKSIYLSPPRLLCCIESVRNISFGVNYSSSGFTESVISY